MPPDRFAYIPYYSLLDNLPHIFYLYLSLP